MQSATGAPPEAVACTSCHRTIAAGDAYCRYCGKRQRKADDWIYHPIVILVLAFFVLGPLAIPLVQKSPRLNQNRKLIMNAVIIVYFLLVIWFAWWITIKAIRQFSELGAEMGM